jgi:hypothetical protein
VVDAKIEQLQGELAALGVTVRDGFAEIRAGFAEMRAGFAGVNARLDDLTDVTHRIYHEHGQRLKDLEHHLIRNSRS